MQTDATLPGWAPLTDEDALLREALAFIGDLELDEGELSPPSVDADTFTRPVSSETSASDGFFSSLLAEPLGAPPAQPAPTPIAGANTPSIQQASPPSLPWPQPATGPNPPKPPGNRSRTKRREELLYLRDLVGDLESQLVQLKRQADEQQMQMQLDQLDDGNEQARPSALVLAAWEQVATRQYEQRQRSEMENIKLKRLLEDQIQVGKSLERLLLRKRPKLEGNDRSIRFEKRARHGSLCSSWTNAQIFDELLATIGRQHVETARTLNKLDSLLKDKGHHRAVELVHEEELGMVLRTTECRIVPFEYELVVQEYWDSMPVISDDRYAGSPDVDVADDLIKTQFRANAIFGRMSADMTVYMADRRYCEATRTVVVSAAFFDPTEIAETNMDGVYMRHRGWVVFEPIVPHQRNAVSATTKAATRMTSYMLAVPETYEGLEDQTRKVGTLTNFLMSVLSIELETRQQAFENRLFDRSNGVLAK